MSDLSHIGQGVNRPRWDPVVPSPAHGEVPQYTPAPGASSADPRSFAGVTPAAAPVSVSTADRVKLLQVKLNQMGAQPPLAVDGVLGPKTQAAMGKYGLDVNGNPVTPSRPAPPSPSPGAPAGGAPPAPAPTTPAASPQDIDTQIRQQYGYLGFLLDNAEIHNVLTQAVTQGWDAQRLQGALMGTTFWQQTSAANRNWMALQGSDPESARAQVTQKRADIQQIATQLGVSIADDRLTAMATDTLKYGLDATQLQQMIGSEFHYQPGQQVGSIGKAEVDLKAIAGDYFVPLSDATLGDWERKIAQGMNKPEDFQNEIIGFAKDTYKAPWIQQALDQGRTMRNITDPYRQTAAQLLEVSPDSIDFTNPKWQVALTQQDAKTGAPMGMDLASWQRTLKSDPTYGWDRTQNAQQQGNDFALKLLQGLGRAS